ncbi:PHD finger protein 20 isoform X2 [Pleurodeles waltl]|uniref:PHD finger protein 20 isoform X2 n=1 Tax=Pleurodeles waltl TaxID=8319 RepID=UPI0037096960
MTKNPPNRRGITFEVGAQLEARDRLKKWYAALIEEINFEEGKVLIHFKHWNHRHDEWFFWDSPDLRPEEKIQLRTEGLHSEPVQPEFRVNQQVLACWSDCRFYPAKVTAANKDGTYTVKFFDGIVQTVKNIHVKPCSKDQNLACTKPKERSKDISLRTQKKREKYKEQRSSTEINRKGKDEHSQNIDKSKDPDKPVASDTSKLECDTDKSISVSEGHSKKDPDKDKLFATAEERKKDPENQNVIVSEKSRTDCEKQKINAISEEHKIPDMHLPNTEKEDKENILKNDNDTLIDKHLEIKTNNSHRAPGNRRKRSRQQSSSSADPASQTLQPIFLTLRRRKISISVGVQSKRSRLEKNLHGLPSVHIEKPTTSSHNIQRRKKRNMSLDGQEKVKVRRRSSRLSSADIQKTTEVVRAPSTAEVVEAWLESASSSKEPLQTDNTEKLPKSSSSFLRKVKLSKSQAHCEKLQIPRRSSRLSSCSMPEMTEVLHLPAKVESLKEHASITPESPQEKHIETVLDIQTEETLIDFSGKIKRKPKPGRSTKRSSNSMQEMVDVIHMTIGPTVTHPLNEQPSSPKQPPQEEVSIPQPRIQSEAKSNSLPEVSEETQFMRAASQQSSNTSLEIIDEVFVTSALSVKHNLKEQTSIQKKPPEFTQECLCDQISFMETKQFLHFDEPYEIAGMEISSTTIEGKPESSALEGKPERKALDRKTESKEREDENENQSLARKTESKAVEDDKASQSLERKTENKAEVQSESEALEGRTESEALVGQFESKAHEGTTESEALEAKTEGGDIEVKTERAAVKGKTELHGVEQTHCEEVERKTECEAGGERTGSKAVEGKIDSVAAESKTESNKCLKPNDGKETTALQVTTLRRHSELLTCKVLTSELDRSKFKCKIKDCSKFFRKAKLLHYHMKYFHGVEKTEQVQKSVTRTIQTRGSLANEKNIQEIPKRRRTTSGSLNTPLPLELRCSHSDVKTEKQNEKRRHSVPSSDTVNIHPLLRDKSKDNHLNKYHRKQPEREKQHDCVLKDKKNKEKKSKDPLRFKAKKKKKKKKKSKPELLGSEENSETAQELSPKKIPTSDKPHPALRTPYCQEKVPLQSSDTWPIKDQLKKNEEDTLSDSSADSLLWSEDEYSQEIDVTTNPEEAVEEDERDFEIVRCMCELQEENNFMIQVRTVDPDKLPKRLHFQCEECLCWQHRVCMGLLEDNVPEKYTCFICQNPPGQRSGLKYWYDKDWLKNGHLHGLSFLEENYSHQNAKKIIATHQLLGDVHRVIELLHGLQLKMSVLQNKDHPDLKLWCLPWKQLTVDNKCHARRFHPDICGKEDSTNYRTFNGAVERPSVPSVEESYITSEHCYQKPRAYYPAIEQRLVVETRGSAMDDGVNRVRENGDDAIALMLGWELDRDKNMMERDSKHNYCKVREHAPKKSSPGEVFQMKLMDNIGDGVLNTQLQWKLNLINHVESLQDEVTHRMDFIEKELDVLESFLDYTGELEPPEPLARLPQLKHRVKQLLLDLGKVQQIALCCSTCV